jgi:hypothetical protein
MGLAVVVLEGVEFPGPSCGVGFAVGADMLSGFEFGFQLGFAFRSAVVLCHVRVGIGKDSGVVLLSGRLVFLVGFFARAVELPAITGVKVARIGLVEFAADAESLYDIYTGKNTWI